jgi:hypothetical protein
MLDFTKPRELGDFGNSFLLAPYQATARALHPEATLFGLPNAGMVFWGTFEDEDGVSYCLCREVPGYLTGGCWVMSNADGTGMRLLPNSAGLWSGGLAIDAAGERIDWRSADVWRGKQPAFAAWFTPGRAEYRETDFVELVALPGASGYQFYEPTHAQGTGNHVYTASGRIGEKAVTGWLDSTPIFKGPASTIASRRWCAADRWYSGPMSATSTRTAAGNRARSSSAATASARHGSRAATGG